jgi:DNA-binding NtrC family response regulator
MEHRLQPFGILIVEDDQLLGRVLERVLSCDGQAAVHVGDGGHAMRLLNKHVPRVVLIDTGLRNGTALTLVEAIGATYPALPIILLTAHRLDSASLSRSVHQVVTKSIDLPELRRIVQTALCANDASPRERQRDFVGHSAPWNETASSPVHATSASG